MPSSSTGICHPAARSQILKRVAKGVEGLNHACAGSGKNRRVGPLAYEDEGPRTNLDDIAAE